MYGHCMYGTNCFGRTCRLADPVPATGSSRHWACSFVMLSLATPVPLCLEIRFFFSSRLCIVPRLIIIDSRQIDFSCIWNSLLRKSHLLTLHRAYKVGNNKHLSSSARAKFTVQFHPQCLPLYWRKRTIGAMPNSIVRSMENLLRFGEVWQRWAGRMPKPRKLRSRNTSSIGTIRRQRMKQRKREKWVKAVKMSISPHYETILTMKQNKPGPTSRICHVN